MLRCPGHLGALEFRYGSLEVSLPRARRCLSHRPGGRMERIGWWREMGSRLGGVGNKQEQRLGAKTLLRGVQLRVVVKGGGVCCRGWQGAWGTKPVCPAEGLSLARSVTCRTFRRWSLDLGPDSSTTITEFCHSPVFAAVRRGVILAPVPSFQRAG